MGYDLVVPLVDARRMEVYTAVFDGNTGETLVETHPKILDENSFLEYKGMKILFVGDGTKKTQGILSFEAEYNEDVYPSAKYMIEEAVGKFHSQKFEDIAYFEPFYLKEFQGVKMKK